jgi:hypothetical protein
MTFQLSRRNLVATAAALPALAVPAVAVALPTSTLSDLADQICAEWDRLGTLHRDLEDSDWSLFDSLDRQLSETPATSLADFAAKARVLDKKFRINGELHSIADGELWRLVD